MVALVLVLALVGAAQAQNATYGRAVDAYISGGIEAAAPVLAKVPQKDVELSANALATSATPDASVAARTRVEAAAMLHTEYALAFDLGEHDWGFHIDMAHLLLSFERRLWLNQRGVPKNKEWGMTDPAVLLRHAQHAREFLPHWYAVAATAFLLRGMDGPAAALIDEALKMWPADPLLLYHDGVVKEFRAVWRPLRPQDPDALLAQALRETGSRSFDASLSRRNWEPAATAYRNAVEKDPSNAETRLHLGYVLLMLGDAHASRTELAAARDGSTDGFVVYLAHLFLGRLMESQADLAGAVEEYERALALGRFCQTPYIALSALQSRLGNGGRARGLIDAFVSIPADQLVRDPWWAYHTVRIPQQDLQWLRQQVRR
jgi:tetratricopeptide (TPR) repeat protein